MKFFIGLDPHAGPGNIQAPDPEGPVLVWPRASCQTTANMALVKRRCSFLFSGIPLAL
jgi:hypothetical protein